MNHPILKAFSVKRLALSVPLLLIPYCLSLIAFATPAFAQTTPTTPCPEMPQIAQQRNDYNKAAIDSGQYDSNVFQGDSTIYGITDGLNTLLTGCSLIHPKTNSATAGTGALAGARNLITALYSAPPASGVQYFAQKIKQFNPTRDAYAASDPGIGFKALSPIQPLWTAFRNISYLGFILVFIVIGFMVMFRAKISPQAVATVQDSLPRIVVALILVTFSYALVGLMIDAMFVILNVAINALGPGGAGLIDVQTANNNVVGSNVFSAVMGAQGGIFMTVAGAISDIIQKLFDSGALVKVLGFLGGSLVAIIAAIAMLFVMFKVFIMLLMAYVSVIILTIFAPFILLFQAMPGSNGAKEWFKQIAANLSVFPVVALMFILAGILGNISSLGSTGKGAITGGDVGQFPLLTGQLNVDSITSLIGIGILFMTPSAAKIVKERFGVKEGALGAGAGAGLATFGAGAAAGRRIGAEVGPHVPYVSSAADYIAARREMPKIRRQAAISEHAGKQGYQYQPGIGYARSTKEGEGTGE